MFSNKPVRLAVILLVAAIALTACSSPAATPTPAPKATPQVAATDAPTPAPPPTNTAVVVPPTPAVISSATKSAGLRAALDRLLSEHVVLATSATSAALAGRAKDFEAAAAALDANSVDISKTIGSVYGAPAETAFLPLWRKHIGLVVDYTTGLATKSKTKSDKAAADLLVYADDLGAFFNSANPNLPKATVADLVKAHVATLKEVIDAQAAGDYAKGYAATRKAFAHMDVIANALAGASAKQFPDKLDGNADASGSKLRSALTLALSEHVSLTSAATGAAFGGRDADFKAAADSLDANSAELSKAIGSVYGDAAEKAFLPLWRKHIALVVDYAGGLAIKDKAKSDKAMSDLVAYADDLGAFFNSANPNLPKAAVADLVKTHFSSLKDVLDAQAAGDYAKAYPALRKAFTHMSVIADPLADASVKQFPDKFK
ncbi:MAG: hypothetical protein HY327_03870 [Chloroflexi bacterium]|nr:hypothetical protein [Chloroflexota bacterium]